MILGIIETWLRLVPWRRQSVAVLLFSLFRKVGGILLVLALVLGF